VANGLGTKTAVITRIGEDARGSDGWQKMLRSGVSLDCCEVHANLPTATTVCAAFDGDRLMITHDAINRNLEKLLNRSVVKKRIRNAQHLHLACALWPPNTWSLAVRRFREQGLTVSADIGWNPRLMQSSQLSSLLRNLEFVFPNEAEARVMTGEKSIEKAAKQLARWVRIPVIKLGQDGSIAVHNGKMVKMKSLRVRAMDATGSGDAFNGGFLHGYLAGWPLEDCLRAGNICGALATTRPGGSSAIPTLKKLRELMNKL
jgi:sugar/nucleoside kinase (ribokinase family)